MMHFTTAQLQAIKAAMLGDPNLTALIAAGNHTAIAEYMNQPHSPDFWVWKTMLTRGELYDAINWTTYIGRNQGERDAFNAILVDGSLNPSHASIRAAFNDIFSGVQQAAVDQRAAIEAAERRKANRIEKIFATGTGSTASPGLLVFEGELDAAHVADALVS